MSRLSIKTRVALWYTCSLMAILTVAGFLLILAGDRLILGEQKNTLVYVTDDTLNDVRVVDGRLVIDRDIVYYRDGVTILLYRDDGTQLSGLLPELPLPEMPFEADQVRRFRQGENAVYVYDRLIENSHTGKIWVRGIAPARIRDIDPSAARILKIFLIILPLLILIAFVGGWWLTRQAFAPLGKIIDTARGIRESGKPDRRIGLGNPDDSDEIRRAAAEFDLMLDRIEDSFAMEKQFTNDASHELRTPISVILAESEYALDNPEDREETEEALKVIRKQAGQMSELVSRLLMMARADRGIEPLKKEMTDLSLLAEESLDRFREEASRCNIRLGIRAEECCYINGNPPFLGRMIDNLVDNSLKYGKTGGKTLVRVYREDQKIYLTVEDNGIGMEEDELPHIWERFYRASHVTGYGKNTDGGEEPAAGMTAGNRYSGMGLGLPLVRKIVEEHDGEITVSSSPGEGTTFQIVFPAMEEYER